MYFSICKPYCPYKICTNYNLINEFIKETLNEIHDTNVFSNLIHDISNLEMYNDDYKKIKNNLKEEINNSK